MDPQKELNRLRRLVIVSWSLGVLSVVAIVLFFSLQLRSLKDEILSKPTTVVKETIKQEALPGPIGPIGIAGSDSLSTHTVAKQPIISQVNVPVPGAPGAKGDVGEKGDKGEKGDPGRTIIARSNPETGVDECKYPGDFGWQPLAECE